MLSRKNVPCLLYWFGPTVVYLGGLKVVFSFQNVLVIFLSCCVSGGKECTRKELTFNLVGWIGAKPRVGRV